MRIGTIGSGMIAKLFLDAINLVEGVTCEAIYSRSEETAKQLANDYNVGKHYTNLDEMLADERIDFVYIASPNSIHYSQAKEALLHNKHVICEKPLTSTFEQLTELVELAKTRNLFFFEAITTIHLPNFHHVQSWLSQIGKIRMVHASFLQYSSKMDALNQGKVANVFNPDFSGGALMDLNVYNLHFAIALFGKPNDVIYHPQLHSNGIDLGGVLVLKYPDFMVNCVAGKHVQGINNAAIYGEKGYVLIDDEVSFCSSVHMKNKLVKQSYNNQPIENRIFYELTDFKEVFEKHDYEKHNQWLNHSLMVYDILHQARIEAGIEFKDDKK